MTLYENTDPDFETVIEAVRAYLLGVTRTGETVQLTSKRIGSDLGIDSSRVGGLLGRIESGDIDAGRIEVGRWSDRSAAVTWEITRR